MSIQTAEPRAALSIEEVAKLTGIGRTRLYEEVKNGRLRTLKVGRRTIIRASEVEAFLDRLEAEAESTAA